MTFELKVDKISEKETATIRRSAHLRVLVVDDNDCLLLTVQQMVEALGLKN